MNTNAKTDRKSAIVTGASKGIGRAIALRLGREDFAVTVGYAGSRGAAEEVARQIQAEGGRAIAVQGDVADEADVAAVFDAAEKAFGGLDAVVNSAGVMELFTIADGDSAQFDKIISTNLRGTFLVLQQAARRIRNGGRIVALSSSVLAPAFPQYGAYIASKAGVEGLVRVLANEMRGKQVTVNAVAPGPVATDLFLEGKSPELVERLSKLPPLERLGQPEDIAGLVSFLLGPDGGWVNAQILRANGGFA